MAPHKRENSFTVMKIYPDEVEWDTLFRCLYYKQGKRWHTIQIEQVLHNEAPIGWQAKGKHPKDWFLIAIRLLEQFSYSPEDFKQLKERVEHKQLSKGFLFWKSKWLTILLVSDEFERITGKYDPEGFQAKREYDAVALLFPVRHSNPFSPQDPLCPIDYDETKIEPGPPLIQEEKEEEE
jgi:hypothetical protein